MKKKFTAHCNLAAQEKKRMVKSILGVGIGE